MDKEKRKIYLDCLRIMATFAVMTLHVCAEKWSLIDVETIEWHVLNFYECIVGWAVPVFVMISGTLFLSSNKNIVDIYNKNIKRLITAFIFWSVVYALKSFFFGHCGLKSMIIQIFQGHYHMWFLFMIVGLYIIIPFLHKIVESMELTKYFFILSLIFTFMIPQIVALISIRSEKIGIILDGIFDFVNFHFTLGYASYFISGYYVDKVDLNPKMQKRIYLLGILGFMVTFLSSSAFSVFKHKADNSFNGNLTLNVMLESVMIFVFAKYNLNLININRKFKGYIIKLSKYSFGAYMVHDLVISLVRKLFGLDFFVFYPVISIPIISVLVCIISFTISWILNNIPIFNKYIV